MKWLLLASISLLAVSIYTIIDEQSKYAALEAFTRHIAKSHNDNAKALQACVSRSYLKAKEGVYGSDESWVAR